jgi:hypothetical protein
MTLRPSDDGTNGAIHRIRAPRTSRILDATVVTPCRPVDSRAVHDATTPSSTRTREVVLCGEAPTRHPPHRDVHNQSRSVLHRTSALSTRLVDDAASSLGSERRLDATIGTHVHASDPPESATTRDPLGHNPTRTWRHQETATTRHCGRARKDEVPGPRPARRQQVHHLATASTHRCGPISDPECHARDSHA